MIWVVVLLAAALALVTAQNASYVDGISVRFRAFSVPTEAGVLLGFLGPGANTTTRTETILTWPSPATFNFVWRFRPGDKNTTLSLTNVDLGMTVSLEHPIALAGRACDGVPLVRARLGDSVVNSNASQIEVSFADVTITGSLPVVLINPSLRITTTTVSALDLGTELDFSRGFTLRGVFRVSGTFTGSVDANKLQFDVCCVRRPAPSTLSTAAPTSSSITASATMVTPTAATAVPAATTVTLATTTREPANTAISPALNATTLTSASTALTTAFSAPAAFDVVSIAAGVGGGVAALLLIGLVVFFVCRARRSKAAEPQGRELRGSNYQAAPRLVNEYDVGDVEKLPASEYGLLKLNGEPRYADPSALAPGGIQVKQTGVGTEYAAM